MIQSVIGEDDATAHSESGKKKRQTEEDIGRQYRKVNRDGLCQQNLGSWKQE